MSAEDSIDNLHKKIEELEGVLNRWVANGDELINVNQIERIQKHTNKAGKVSCSVWLASGKKITLKGDSLEQWLKKDVLREGEPFLDPKDVNRAFA